MPLERHGLRWTTRTPATRTPSPAAARSALYRELDRTAGKPRCHPCRATERGGGSSSPRCSTRSTRSARRCSAGSRRSPARRDCSRALGPLGTARFASLLPGSAQGLGRRLFERRGLRAWLYGSAGHGDVPPTDAGSAVAVAYLNLMGHAVGWPSPTGGAERLTDALVGYLGALGGEVRTGARVEAIEAAHGRAVGVRVAGGERIAADVVVADVMPARARQAGRRRAVARLSRAAAPLPVRAGDGQGRLGARRPDPVGGRGASRRRHRACCR